MKEWEEEFDKFVEAAKVCEQIEYQYSEADWFRGICVICSETGEYLVSVRVAIGLNPSLPDVIDGIDIHLEERACVVAYQGEEE